MLIILSTVLCRDNDNIVKEPLGIIKQLLPLWSLIEVQGIYLVDRVGWFECEN